MKCKNDYFKYLIESNLFLICTSGSTKYIFKKIVSLIIIYFQLFTWLCINHICCRSCAGIRQKSLMYSNHNLCSLYPRPIPFQRRLTSSSLFSRPRILSDSFLRPFAFLFYRALHLYFFYDCLFSTFRVILMHKHAEHKPNSLRKQSHVLPLSLSFFLSLSQYDSMSNVCANDFLCWQLRRKSHLKANKIVCLAREKHRLKLSIRSKADIAEIFCFETWKLAIF